jgi:HAD superfamily hydrolase (TIGR01509 family)
VTKSASMVVSFDIGQTLVDLDLDFLIRRLAGRGITVDKTALETSAPAAWRTYDERTEGGASHPWKAFMQALLVGAGVPSPEPEVDWLYTQQATHNLWRKPIAPMVQLVADLRAEGMRIAAVSNSEGHLADLLGEIGLAPLFHAIIDSERVGIAKPDPKIFAITLEQLGIENPDLAVHVGDSWAADVEGALAASWHAIWYRSRGGKAQHDPRVPIVHDAAETRSALSMLARQAGHPTTFGV